MLLYLMILNDIIGYDIILYFIDRCIFKFYYKSNYISVYLIKYSIFYYMLLFKSMLYYYFTLYDIVQIILNDMIQYDTVLNYIVY